MIREKHKNQIIAVVMLFVLSITPLTFGAVSFSHQESAFGSSGFAGGGFGGGGGDALPTGYAHLIGAYFPILEWIVGGLVAWGVAKVMDYYYEQTPVPTNNGCFGPCGGGGGSTF